ncbi:MAG TPA: hypothetical protein VF899_05340 [Pyrinomonadaceae bacterium]
MNYSRFSVGQRLLVPRAEGGHGRFKSLPIHRAGLQQEYTKLRANATVDLLEESA